MSPPSWSPITCHRPVHEVSREDGGASAVERRRREAGIVDRNALSPEEAVAMIQAIRSKALRELLPDSTPAIRAERDGRRSSSTPASP